MSLEELLEVEKSFWTSSGDQSFYQTHVADGGRFVLSIGILDKQKVVASMAEAQPWESFDIHEPSYVPISDGVAAVVYEATGRRHADDDDEYRANILSVYTSVDGDWQLILHQQTPLDTH